MVPLRRNRDFVLLESGRLLSSAGSQLTTIAYPLLVLALTHSPAKAGIVSFARLIPHALFALVAGVAADRWNRKRLMLAADGVRALAIASLVTTIVLHRLVFWQIPLVAFIEGMGAVFFLAAQPGALRAVVPRRQLPAAVGAQGARASVVRLAGPPVDERDERDLPEHQPVQNNRRNETCDRKRAKKTAASISRLRFQRSAATPRPGGDCVGGGPRERDNARPSQASA